MFVAIKQAGLLVGQMSTPAQRKQWKNLQSLMGFFLLGYALTAVLILKHFQLELTLVTGLVFLFGSLFVLKTVQTGRESIHSLDKIIEERTADLVLARQEAEQAVEARTRFMANVSHEIRTPMNAVVGLTSLLMETELDEDQRKDLRTLQEAGNVLLRVVTDVLDFAKMESDTFKLERAPLSLPGLVESSLGIWSSAASEKDIQLKAELAEGFWPYWVGDSTRLQQLLHNLVANAIRFTDQGSVTVRAREESEGVVVEVEDTGCGIPLEDQEQIFHSFRQSSTDRGGTGLGLTICHRICEMMGGTLEVESTVGRGSLFRLALPLQRAEGIEPTHTSSHDEPFPTYQVLLADDNEVNLNVARRFLERLGCVVDTVGNGSEAVELCHSKAYDLILMDCQMPVMTGLEATVEIRRRETGTEQHRLIYALTAMATAGELQSCIDQGMDGYITKPIRLSRLKTLLASLPALTGRK